jgi:hypothetical protein
MSTNEQRTYLRAASRFEATRAFIFPLHYMVSIHVECLHVNATLIDRLCYATRASSLTVQCAKVPAQSFLLSLLTGR